MQSIYKRNVVRISNLKKKKIHGDEKNENEYGEGVLFVFDWLIDDYSGTRGQVHARSRPFRRSLQVTVSH